MANRRSVLKACVVATGVTGCTTPTTRDTQSDTAGSWTKFRYDRRNTGHNPHADGPSRNPELKWSFEAGDAVWGSPVVADEILYIGSYDHYLYAISTDTGEKIWEFQSSDRIDGTPAVVDGTVYFASFDKNIYALDAKTGEKRWDHSTNGLIRSSPTVADGTVYIGTHCRSAECNIYYDELFPVVGYVYALDAETGDSMWRYETGDEILSSPSVVEGTVYIGSSDGKLYAIDQPTGELNWEFDTGGSIFSSPAVVENTVYFSSNRDEFYALDSDTGERMWSFPTSAGVLTSSPAIHDDTVYVGGGGISDADSTGIHSKLYAISKESGEESWSRDLPGEVIGSSPAIADDVIYASSNNFADGSSANPGIFAHSLSGEEYWRYTVTDSEYFSGGAGFGSSPAVVDDTLYIGGADGRIYAFT